MESHHLGKKNDCDQCSCKFLLSTELKRHKLLCHTVCVKCNVEQPSAVYISQKWCLSCGHFMNNVDPITKRQDVVFEALQRHYPQYELVMDRVDRESKECGNFFRVDIYFHGVFHRRILVEIDEHQHKGASYRCLSAVLSDKVTTRQEARELKENDRMSDIAGTGEILPTVFIRFNTDAWKNEKKQRPKIPLEARIKVLITEIDSWLDPEKLQDNFVTVVYLYYDGPWRREEWIPVSPEELPEYNRMIEEKYLENEPTDE